MANPRCRTHAPWLAALAIVFLSPREAAASPAADPGRVPLAAKAERFLADLRARHLSREGLVLYRVDLRSIRRDLREGSYPDLADGPTFNGMLAAGACRRAQGADEPEGSSAAELAERALAGLELLHDVTGVPGLFARAVRRGDPPATRAERWRRGTGPHAAYSWRGDVSMDQYANGVLPAIAACADLYPARARRLIRAVAQHLQRSGGLLIDPDGERTRYGDLSPHSGLGLNAPARLAGWGVFALAAALDPGDPRWAERRDELRDVYRVPATARTTNLRVFSWTNPSNDLMAFHLYRALIPLARAGGDPALADLRHGLVRAWQRVRPDGNPYFELIYCELEPGACPAGARRRAAQALGAMPGHKRKRATAADLARLAALPRRWLPGRKWRPHARRPVPYELRPVSSFEWKSSPYRVRPRLDEHTEYTGIDYLLVWWMLGPADPADPADPANPTDPEARACAGDDRP